MEERLELPEFTWTYPDPQPQRPQQPEETGVGQPDRHAQIWDAADESRMDKMGKTLDWMLQRKREQEAAAAQQQGQGQQEPQQQEQPPQG